RERQKSARWKSSTRSSPTNGGHMLVRWGTLISAETWTPVLRFGPSWSRATRHTSKPVQGLWRTVIPAVNGKKRSTRPGDSSRQSKLLRPGPHRGNMLCAVRSRRKDGGFTWRDNLVSNHVTDAPGERAVVPEASRTAPVS